MITFDHLYISLIAIKNAIDTKADSEHGEHVIYASEYTDLVPGDPGNKGSANTVARGDHTHTLPAYPTELKNPEPLVIVINDTEEMLYDGSETKTIDITNQTLDAAPTYHASPTDVYGLSSSSDYGHAKASSTVPLAPGDGSVGLEVNAFARGDHSHPEQLNVSGNAGTANKLLDSVTLTVGLSAKEFDGSRNVSWSIDEIGAAAIERTERALDTEVSAMVDNVLGIVDVDPSLAVYATNKEVYDTVHEIFKSE